MRNKKQIIHDDEDMIADLESGGYEVIENENAEIQRYAKIFQESGKKSSKPNPFDKKSL